MYCSTRSLQYLLFFFNTICASLGVVLIWFGFWLLDSLDEVKIDHGEYLAAILVIILGVVVLLTAVFGCIGVYTKCKRLLTSYAVLLVFLLVIQLILVSISYTAASEGLAEGLRQGFDELWDPMEHPNSTLSYYEAWLQCCGKNSAEDYFLVDKTPPSSCCKDHDCTNVLNLYMAGCHQKFREYVKGKTAHFNTVSWFLIIIEFICSVFACVLVDRIRNHRDRIRFYN